MRRSLRALVFLIVLATGSARGIVYIDGSGTDYVQLSNALAHAVNNDLIIMSTGTYYEVQTITSLVVHIEGGYNHTGDVKVPGGRTILSGAEMFGSKGSVFQIMNSSVLLKDLDITGGGPTVASFSLFGGGVYSSDSSVTMRNCRVYGNTCKGRGGGIFSYHSQLEITNTPVYDNWANRGTVLGSDGSGMGGGVYVSGGSFSAAGESTNENNGAVDGGGGVYLQGADATFRDHAAVNYNHAPTGGGVYAISSRLDLGSNADVMGNVATNDGGGLYLLSSTGMFFSGNTYIGFNTAPNRAGAGNGGGLYARDSQLQFKDCNVQINMAAGRGGGLYLESSVCVLDNVRVGWYSASWTNEALYGGGIYTILSDLVLTNATKIQNCRATVSGGGLYASRSSVTFYPGVTNGHSLPVNGNVALLSGGGMFTFESTTRVYGAKFVNNLSRDDGGGLYMWDSQLDAKDAVFQKNTAQYSNGVLNVGGGIFGYTCRGILNGVTVDSNVASRGAGVYWAGYGSLAASNGCRLAGNTADEGGGLYLGYYSQAALRDVTVADNLASNQGGGVYVVRSGLTLVDSMVEENDAATLGGGICLYSNSMLSFTAEEGLGRVANNTAGRGGGLWIGPLSTATLSSVSALPVEFAHNTSAGDGAGVAVSNGTCLAQGRVEIYSNEAGSSGGGVSAEAASWIGFSLDGTSPWLYANEAVTNGGGLYAQDAGTICELYYAILGGSAPADGNRANGAGGGAALYRGASLRAISVRVCHNQSNIDGGGVYASESRVEIDSDDTAPENPLLPQTWLTHNRSTNHVFPSYGGALTVIGGTASVARAYVSENEAARGGGLYVGGAGEMRCVNSIIQSNTAVIGAGVRVNGEGTRCALLHCDIMFNATSGVETATAGLRPTVSLTNCIVGLHPGDEITPGHNVGYSNVKGGYPGPGNINLDSLFFDPLANDLRLRYGSPCINAGTNLVEVTVDITGAPRPVGRHDMGAYEYDGRLYDTDGDGMVDNWEDAHTLNPVNPADAGGDPDSDADINLREFWADTDPWDSNDFFRVFSISNGAGARKIEVPSSAIRRYDLERCDLLTGTWNPLADQSGVPGTGARLFLEDTNAVSTEWSGYRARVYPPPAP